MIAEGPYCPIPQHRPPFPQYVHVVYPTASGLINDRGTVREMTVQELEAFDRMRTDDNLWVFT